MFEIAGALLLTYLVLRYWDFFIRLAAVLASVSVIGIVLIIMFYE